MGRVKFAVFSFVSLHLQRLFLIVFRSLADVYEGALRNVLDIQLHLTLDDQQSFTQNAINDLLFRDKSSPGQHRAPLRQEQLKRRSENHQHERPTEESKDLNNSGSFQGRTLLRDPRRVSPGGSAFHVPPKKARMEEEMQYSERGFPMDRYGVPPSGNGFPPDYPSSFPSPRGSPGMYHRRVTGPEAAAHVYGTNGIHIPVPRDRYSLWSFGHHRDATLFPMRCSSVESERRFHRGLLEEEKQRSMDFARLNGFAHEKPAVRVKIEKETKEESLKGDQKPSPTERQSSLSPGKETGLEKRAEREKLSPSSSPKFSKPNTLLPTYRSSPINGTGAIDFRMKTRYRSALRKIESRREGKKGSGEDAKDEFLFKLGLERIEA